MTENRVLWPLKNIIVHITNKILETEPIVRKLILLKIPIWKFIKMDTYILGTLGKDFWCLSTLVWQGQARWHCWTSCLWPYLGSFGASPSLRSWQISSRDTVRLTETIHLAWHEHTPLPSPPLTWMVWKPCRCQPLYWKSLLEPQKANLLEFSQGNLRSWKFQGEGDRRKIHSFWEETEGRTYHINTVVVC